MILTRRSTDAFYNVGDDYTDGSDVADSADEGHCDDPVENFYRAKLLWCVIK